MWTPELIIYGFLIFLMLILLEVPIAISLGCSSIIILLINGNFPLSFIAQRMYAGLDSFTLLALPLFIFVGQSMNSSRITDRIFNFAKCLIGSIAGGLAHVNVLASIIFAGMSGSATADAGGLGLVELKAMCNAGFDKKFSAAVTAASSTIGPIIPPSIPLVVYATMSNASIGKLFIGGVIPGLLMGFILMFYIYVISSKKDLPRERAYSLKEKMESFVQALPALFAPVLLVGGILLGIFTPTEGAAVTAIYTLFLGFVIYRDLTIKNFFDILKFTAKTSGAILIVISLSNIFSYFISIAQIPQIVVNTLFEITQNKYIILLLINIVLLIGGCFMESLVLIAIGTPILIPVINALGISEVHFGIMMILNLMIGGITPPFGLLTFTVANISKISTNELFKAVLPFLVPLLIVLLLVTFIPEITLFMPNLIYGNR